MQKRFVKFLSLALLAIGIGMSTQQVTSHAWTSTNKYTWNSGKDQAAIYYTNTKRNAYIWNSRFSKKLHNLKNYQHTTWYVTRSFVRKNKVYYSISNYGSKVKGYIWHGYVTPAVVKDINSFDNDAQYLNYLKSDKSQKLTRALLKLIPNVNVSLNLSQQAAMNKITDYQNVINLGMISGTVTEGMLTHKTIVHDFLMHPNSSVTGRAKTVGKMLAAKGYTRDKLASLMNQGYQVGIYVNDGAANSVGKSGYPSTISFTTPIQNNMAFVLAKAK